MRDMLPLIKHAHTYRHTQSAHSHFRCFFRLPIHEVAADILAYIDGNLLACRIKYKDMTIVYRYTILNDLRRFCMCTHRAAGLCALETAACNMASRTLTTSIGFYVTLYGDTFLFFASLSRIQFFFGINEITSCAAGWYSRTLLFEVCVYACVFVFILLLLKVRRFRVFFLLLYVKCVSACIYGS